MAGALCFEVSQLWSPPVGATEPALQALIGGTWYLLAMRFWGIVGGIIAVLVVGLGVHDSIGSGQGLEPIWTALTGVGTLGLAVATYAILLRDEDVGKRARTPNLVLVKPSFGLYPKTAELERFEAENQARAHDKIFLTTVSNLSPGSILLIEIGFVPHDGTEPVLMECPQLIEPNASVPLQIETYLPDTGEFSVRLYFQYGPTATEVHRLQLGPWAIVAPHPLARPVLQDRKARLEMNVTLESDRWLAWHNRAESEAGRRPYPWRA